MADTIEDDTAPTPPPRPRAAPRYQGPERRQWDGTEMSQLPMWARAIAIIGIPGAIAVYLVWFGSNEIPRISEQQRTTNQEIVNVRELLSDQREDAAALFRMMQRICSNVARNDDERNRCFDR